MGTTITQEGNLCTVTLSGRIDTATAAGFQTDFAPLMQAKGADIRVDCAELSYVSSIGLRLFLLLQKSVSANGSTLVLTGMNPQVKQVFDITGFSKIISIQ